MSLLAGTLYDPAGAVTASTTSLLAMTALDTTNLRLTFTAPSNGTVLVRMRGGFSGSTTYAGLLYGVLDGSTIRFRMAPMGAQSGSTAVSSIMQEVSGLVTGLTPGNSYTWDAAYGVEVASGAGGIKYGGPNDASGVDAWGGLVFEVWQTANLLAGLNYDPATAVAKALTPASAMAAFDTTNLRLASVTAPASGNIYWRIRCTYSGATTAPIVTTMLGVMEGAAVKGRAFPIVGQPMGGVTGSHQSLEASGVMIGVSAGSHTYDAAFAVQSASAAGGSIKYGGPNDTTGDNAWGGFDFELWTA